MVIVSRRHFQIQILAISNNKISLIIHFIIIIFVHIIICKILIRQNRVHRWCIVFLQLTDSMVGGISGDHYDDVIMTTIASQITSLTVVYSTVYSDADQSKHQKVRVTGLCVGNSPGPVNSPHKGPVTRKMFPFDNVIMIARLRVQKPHVSGDVERLLAMTRYVRYITVTS